jgi:hypothetical protein
LAQGKPENEEAQEQTFREKLARKGGCGAPFRDEKSTTRHHMPRMKGIEGSRMATSCEAKFHRDGQQRLRAAASVERADAFGSDDGDARRDSRNLSSFRFAHDGFPSLRCQVRYAIFSGRSMQRSEPTRCAMCGHPVIAVGT